MIVKNVLADGYKNLEGVNIKPHPEYNLITGMNAQGKTNLIEAIWLMTGCRSFRGSKEREYIGINKRNMRIGVHFDDGKRVQSASYVMSRDSVKEKLITLNGVEDKSRKSLFENFKCVVFTPEDVDIVRGAPERKRSFIDMCSCQLAPMNLVTLRKYTNLIAQRNALLKTNSMKDTMYVWDNQIAAIGTYLSQVRYQYVQKLNKVCSELYSRITGGREKLEISYISNIFGKKMEDKSRGEYDVLRYHKKLSENLEEDMRLGYTFWGAHRDDMIIKVNGLNIKDYGSQGQKKTAALVLKLGQAEIYYKNKDEAPVILLDDVMGELDESRQKFVFEIVNNMQVFITACNENAVNGLTGGKHFRVENGKVV